MRDISTAASREAKGLYVLIGIVIVVLGLGTLILGTMQVRGTLPVPRGVKLSPLSGLINVVIGLFLIALGVLRMTGAL